MDKIPDYPREILPPIITDDLIDIEGWVPCGEISHPKY